MKHSHTQQAGRRTSRLFMQDQWWPERHYHIIGKAVPGEQLFGDDDDRRHFLREILRDKLKVIFDIYVYCLIGNHFHLVVETLHPDDVRILIASKKCGARSPSDADFLAGRIDYTTYVYRAFAGALSAYARYFNAKYRPAGGQLFIKPTLHGLTTKHDEPGLHFSRRLAAYVGLNYVKHHLAAPEEYYHWSSLCRRLYGIVPEERLFAFFGGEDEYLRFHHAYLRRYGEAFWAFAEDDLFAGATPRRYLERIGRWEQGEWRPALLERA